MTSIRAITQPSHPTSDRYEVSASYRNHKMTHITLNVGNEKVPGCTIAIATFWDKCAHVLSELCGNRGKIITIQVDDLKAKDGKQRSTVSVRIDNLSKGFADSVIKGYASAIREYSSDISDPLFSSSRPAKLLEKRLESLTNVLAPILMRKLANRTQDSLSVQNISDIAYQQLKRDMENKVVRLGSDDYIISTTLNPHNAKIALSIAKVTKTVLGEGAFGKVVALEPLGKMEAPLALKTIKDAKNTDDARREQHILQRLNMGNRVEGIPPTPHVVTTASGFGVMMPKFDCDLEHLPKKVSIEHLCSGFGQLCVGLKFMHEQGVFHHDIKPANLSFTAEQQGVGRWQFADFGLAECLDDSSDRQNGTGGTPGYTLKNQLDTILKAKKDLIRNIQADDSQLAQAEAEHDNFGLALSFIEVFLGQTSGETLDDICKFNAKWFVTGFKLSNEDMQQLLLQNGCPSTISREVVALFSKPTYDNLDKFQKAIYEHYPPVVTGQGGI